MGPFKPSLQKVALIPPIGLVVLYLIMALLNIGEGTVYPSPNLLFALNTLFLTVSGLIVAILSAWSYHSEGDLSLLFLGMATAVGGVLASVAGFAASVSVNDNVALFNLGFLFSGGFQLLSAVLIVAGAVPSSQSRRKHLLFLGYVAVATLVIISTVLVLGGFAPTFFAASGPTAIRQWIIVGAGVLSAVSSILLCWQYRLSKSKVVFWYALALALLAISLVGLATYKTPNGPYNWATRVSYWLAGVYFLVAILMARPRTSLDSSSESGVSSNWAEAFRNDSRQLENLFSRMFDGFSYHKILVKEGRPVDYVYIAVNDAFEKMTGLKRKDVIGKRVTEILPEIEKDPADWIGVYGKVAIKGQPVIFENYSAPLNRWYSVSAYSPRKGYFVAIFEDITARKKAEEALRESETRFHSTLDNMIEGGQIIGLDWRYIYINKAAENQNQRSNEELLGNRYMDVWPGIESTEVFAKLKRCMEERIPQEMENFFVFPNKTAGWFNLRITPVPEGVFILSVDITEHKKAEEALRESESTLQNIIDGSPAFIFLKDKDGHFITINKWLEQSLGMKREEIRGKTDYDIFPKEVADSYRKNDLQVLETKQPVQTEEIFDSPDGKKYTLLANKFPLFNSAGEIIATCSISTDITQRKEAEEELKRQLAIRNGRNRMLQEALHGGTFETLGKVCLEVAQELTGSAFGFIGEVNERGLEDIAISNPGWTACVMYDQSGHRRLPGNFKIHGIYGRVLLDGKSFFTNEPSSHPDRIGLPQGHPPLKSFIGVPLKDKDKTTGLIALANREGGYSQTELNSLESLAPVIVEAFSRKRAEEALRERTEQLEITQKKLEENAVQLEEYSSQMEELAEQRANQLKDSERLAAIGATAGMVGHDIRNPLQAITSDVFLTKTELASIPDSEEKKNALESMVEIEKNIDYINKIVQDLQDYARPLNPKIEESDLKSIIEAFIAKNGLPKNITVKLKIADEARRIRADTYYLNRILFNLVTNAVQAMPDGGKLTIDAHKEADDTVLSVKDTGVGIPREIQDKMFTLMFTTKSKGQGFGLPVVKRMTESLGGTVSFTSQEGKGTTFTVRLPPPKKKLSDK